jgi:hypothetical protein
VTILKSDLEKQYLCNSSEQLIDDYLPPLIAYLKHGGGVAAAIVRKGGGIIQ